MSQQQDGFLGMVDEFIRQAWLIVSDQRDTILPRNIFRRNDHEFIPGNSRTEGDLSDPEEGNLAAKRRSEKHIWQNHIVDVLGSAGYLVAPLLARNRLADDAIAVHYSILGSGIVYDRRGSQVELSLRTNAQRFLIWQNTSEPRLFQWQDKIYRFDWCIVGYSRPLSAQ